MKKFIQLPLLTLILSLAVSLTQAATTYTLNPLTPFGTRGDGSVQPGDSIGTSPVTGNDVQISAPGGFGIQPGDPTGGSITNATTNIVSTTTNITLIITNFPNVTNGFNMRGLTYDAVSGNLVFVDTHTGSGGAGSMTTNFITITPTSTNTVSTNINTVFTNAAIYVLNRDSGKIMGALNLNGIIGGGGVGCFAAVGAADDGIIYAANQVNSSTNSGFKIYRWNTADTNNPDFTSPPQVAFTNTLSPTERIGQTMAVRGAGTNTQIIVGTSSLGGAGTNIYLFTTADGTNFTSHRIFFPGITTAIFNDGIAFGQSNTFWTKQVGKALTFCAYDPVTFAGTVIASFSGASPNDPLLNLSGIAVDVTNHLLAGLEEIGGTATGGNGKVWLYDIPNPTNHAPSILATRVYTVNFQKTTAPMGYLTFGNGRLYANASNNGLLANTVDSTGLTPPSYKWTDSDLSGQPVIRSSDLPVNTRVAVSNTAHFEVFAVPDVTNYQWFSNNVLIAGANSYYLDVPSVTTNMSGAVFRAVAFNAVGSTNSISSTLTVVSAGDFFHMVNLWSVPANTLALNNATNFITSNGGQGTPNERCIAYNALSNQLLVARGPSFPNMKIMVIDADRGTNGYSYTLKTNGLFNSQQLALVGIGVADDGAVYACGVSSANGSDQSFKVFRWADTGSNTLPTVIFGTNSSAANGNPIADITGSQYYRFGDALAVRGAGLNTEIIVDPQNITKYAGILRPNDNTMTNWNQTGYLLQNIVGSYGAQAYGTVIGRSIQFGPVMNSPFGPVPTFWQKRFNGTAGAPLAGMGYTPGGGIAPLVLANTSAGLFTNASAAINFSLNMVASVELVAGTGTGTAGSKLNLYDVTDLSQAVFLGSQNLPTPGANHSQNGNAVTQVIFGANPVTGTNYIFAIDGNNGIAAYVLSGGVTPPPRFLTQPHNLRVLEGTTASMSAGVDQSATIQWYKGTNSPVYTGTSGTSLTITNATTGSAGDYFAIAANVNGSVTSTVAHVSIASTNDVPSLATVWTAAAGAAGFPYVTADGGPNTPNERAFAYNALSNQLIIVRCPPNSTAYNVYVVDAATGNYLYSMNTNGVLHEGASEVSGSNPIDLVAAGASADGSIYICSQSPNSSGGQAGDFQKMLHVYRWTNSAPTTPPVPVFEGDPASLAANINRRWGDVMDVRGSGTNTQLILDSHEGDYGAVLKPVDDSLNSFTNFWFFDSAGSGSIGRSIQWYTNNTVFEKRKGGTLFLSSFDTNTQSSGTLVAVESSASLGGVAVDPARNLAVGVDFVGSTTSGSQKPDAVSLYDLTDVTSPMLVHSYLYPSNQVPNVNFICQTLITGNRVFALDANNGLMAFSIIPSANSMKLTITRVGSSVNLSWGNSQAVLQSSPAIDPQNWTDIAGPGVTSSLQPASATNVLYRLIQRP